MSLINDLAARLTQWWSTSTKAAKQRRTERATHLRHEASARAQRAASAPQPS